MNFNLLSYKDFQNSFGYDIIRLINNDQDGMELFNIYRRLTSFDVDAMQRISVALYERLPTDDKKEFIRYFFCGNTIINSNNKSSLPYSPDYNDLRSKYAKSDKEMALLPHKTQSNYSIYDLKSIGYNIKIKLLGGHLGIYEQFVAEQYSHTMVHVEPSDLILDCGGYIGDTSVYFYSKTNGNCNIHIFELLEDNISFINDNIKLNNLNSNVFTINQLAVTNTESYLTVSPSGPGSTVIKSSTLGMQKIRGITIDNYVKENNLNKVDFIKMDIEGEEKAALKGAENTIKIYKPKMAICLYHYQADSYLIPEMVNSFCKDYNLYFKWTSQTPYGLEAVLFFKESPPYYKGENL